MAWVLLLVIAGAGFSPARADAALASTPAHEDFGQYLVDHQSDLAPFFDKNGGALIGQAVPLLLAWIGRIMFITLVVGWILDVLLSRGFSMLFAPARAKTVRAFVYATGRLVLSVVLAILLGLAVTALAGASHLVTVLIVLASVFVLVAAAVQVGWIHYLYRSDIFISILFYLTLVVVHGFIALAISVPMLGMHAAEPVVAFVDHTVTPKVEDEVKATKQELATVAPARDGAAAEAARLRDQVSQAQADQVRLKGEIEEKKTSAGYLYSQIVKVHARGDLKEARDQFTAFLAKFPSGPLTGLAKGQLNQVESEIASQEARKKQSDIETARANAQARSDLLARAAKGQVTLSEMRNVLIGKTREDVSALLGAPSETASDRWGFAQEMIVNPFTNQKTGLAVYFLAGTVQGVDYYYGKAGAK